MAYLFWFMHDQPQAMTSSFMEKPAVVAYGIEADY